MIFGKPGIHFGLERFIAKGKLARFLNFLSPWIGPEPAPMPATSILAPPAGKKFPKMWKLSLLLVHNYKLL